MDTIRPCRRLAGGAAVILPLIGTSCGGPSMNPPADRARAALETSLNAWREGKRPGNIEGTDPPVQVADNEWSNGRKRAAFEILREQPLESDKRFAVKLIYTTPAKAEEVNDVILGVSPIAVFREKDYARTLNMDNNPRPATKKRR